MTMHLVLMVMVVVIMVAIDGCIASLSTASTDHLCVL